MRLVFRLFEAIRHLATPPQVPSNDLPSAFESDEQIFVTREPIFSMEECDWVIRTAESEGEGLPSSKSGKYRIGKAWIKDMPSVLSWFNRALEAKLFPILAALFPQVVSDASLLRAHSVAILKYNQSHPRTDVHVDDALLAFTVALSPSQDFVGGGTYFEYIDQASKAVMWPALAGMFALFFSPHPIHKVALVFPCTNLTPEFRRRSRSALVEVASNRTINLA